MAGARVNEASASEVDADVRRTRLVRLKEHEVADPRATDGAVRGIVLCISGAGNRDSHHRENVLNVARAIKPGRAGTAENVRRTEKAERTGREILRDFRGTRKKMRREFAHFMMVSGRFGGDCRSRGFDLRSGPNGDIGAIDRRSGLAARGGRGPRRCRCG